MKANGIYIVLREYAVSPIKEGRVLQSF